MKNKSIDAVTLEIFRQLFSAIADEMGTILGRTASSPNIKERKDYSCAVFNARGELLAQAAHIPVHLGAMPMSVQMALQTFHDIEPGDVFILNDPYRGGTHLPDITVIHPVFNDGALMYFTANRAHHSDVGGSTPGSMPLAREIYHEGLIIPPTRLYIKGEKNAPVWDLILANVRTPEERKGDLSAQVAACQVGAERLIRLVTKYGAETVQNVMSALLDYGERLMRDRLRSLPDGEWAFEDKMDDDGFGTTDLALRVRLTIHGDAARVDFSQSDPQCSGSINAVYAVTVSAVRYCFRCLFTMEVPTNAGLYRPIEVVAPPGTLVNAQRPAAVSAGNVELSQRIVDVTFGALAQALPEQIPAASAGTMNNVTFGGQINHHPFSFYETIAGGAGASPHGPGASGIQTHMTNTMNTPVEVIESRYPVRILRYQIRRGSGGTGQYRGGDGLIREYAFLNPMQVAVISDRRRYSPYGLHGGQPGRPGENLYIPTGGMAQVMPGKFQILVQPGDRLRIETPGGGGWGPPENQKNEHSEP